MDSGLDLFFEALKLILCGSFFLNNNGFDFLGFGKIGL